MPNSLKVEDAKASAINKKVRKIVSQHGHLPARMESISDHADLYAAGLKSLSLVQLMLALEEEFDFEFPDVYLNRRSFRNVATIVACVEGLTSAKA